MIVHVFLFSSSIMLMSFDNEPLGELVVEEEKAKKIR